MIERGHWGGPSGGPHRQAVLEIAGGGIRHPAVTGKTVMRAASRLPATDLDFEGHVLAGGAFPLAFG